jgi:hypothetical protein
VIRVLRSAGERSAVRPPDGLARIKLITLLVGCGLLTAIEFSARLQALANRIGWIHSVLIVVLVFVALLPSRRVLFSVPLTLGTLYLAVQANELKIAAVALPVTFLDVQTALVDPRVVLNALGISTANIYVAGGLTLLIAVVLTVYGLRARSRRIPQSWQTTVRAVVIALLPLPIIVVTGQRSLAAYGRFVNDNIRTLYPTLWPDLWMPPAQVTLSRELGVLEYLAFTYHAGDRQADTGAGAGEYPREDIRSAVSKFVSLPIRPRESRPNIVILHAESTFDPNTAFKLATPIPLTLWSRTDATSLLGPLRVNIVGGGSWVTEFEVLTGVDSRIFGYQGFYTHNYLAPLVRHSLPRYLAAKGYRTTAYYSVSGSFFNAERAFRHYGFEEFVDGQALGLAEDWTMLVDREIVRRVLAHDSFAGDAPFFYFVSTSENHGPHPCRHFKSESEFLVRFSGLATFEQGCTLNEYVRRAQSTADAFELLVQELKRIETETGRPFVLLAYGDHQPWSFTDGLYSVAGGEAADPAMSRFSSLRANADPNLTVYHLVTSVPGVVRGSLNAPPPATLLPTLISSFVAASDDDLYMPINFLAYERCGSDNRQSSCGLSTLLSRWWRHALFEEAPQ